MEKTLKPSPNHCLDLVVKNIHLGPTLPAFVSPAVLNVLVEKFQLSPNSTVEEDIAKMMG